MASIVWGAEPTSPHALLENTSRENSTPQQICNEISRFVQAHRAASNPPEPLTFTGISRIVFDELCKLTGEGHARLSYDFATSTIVVECPVSIIHESPQAWLSHFVTAVQGMVGGAAGCRVRLGGAPGYDVGEDYIQPDGTVTWSREDDEGDGEDEDEERLIENFFPSLVLEVGYSQPPQDLVVKARKWLLESELQVCCVVNVIFTKPSREDLFSSLDSWEGSLTIYTRTDQNDDIELYTEVAFLPPPREAPVLNLRLDHVLPKHVIPTAQRNDFVQLSLAVLIEEARQAVRKMHNQREIAKRRRRNSQEGVRQVRRRR